MKLTMTQRFGKALGVGLLIVNLFGLGSVTVNAQMGHEMMQHGSDSSSGCQQRCSTATVTTVQQNEDTEKDNDQKRAYSYPEVEVSTNYASLKRLTTSPSEDFRLLRPPDLYALYSSYRF